MAFLVWTAGFLLSLIATEMFVRIARWQLSQPLPTRRQSPFSTIPLAFGVQLVSLFGLFVACLTLVNIPNSLVVLAPVLPLAGWCICWSRGLERFVDQLYPNRSLITIALRDVSLNPIGILLAGIYALSPFKSVLETILIGAALLPLYFGLSVVLARRAYPIAKLDRTILFSMAFRFAAGFLLIGLLCWLIWVYIPASRNPVVCLGIGIGFHLLAYFFGTWYEIDLAQRLSKKTALIESDAVTEAPGITTTVPEDEAALTIRLRR